MASLKGIFESTAFRLETLLSQGRRAEAVKYAAQQLRAGTSGPLFLAAVADLLEPKALRPGRPRRSAPVKWFEIGQEFESQVRCGDTYEQAVEILAVKFGQSGRNIERAVRFYRDGKETDDEASRQ